MSPPIPIWLAKAFRHAATVLGMLYSIPLIIAAEGQPIISSRFNATDRPPMTRVFSLECCERIAKQSVILVIGWLLHVASNGGWVVRDWMPSILKKQYNLGQGQAGVAATLYWQVAAIIGVVVGGWLADRWMQRHQRGRIHVSALGMC